jgi:hypothetical protein
VSVTWDEVIQVLREESAIVVHTVGTRKGHGSALTASLEGLDALGNAIRKKPELSCSTIQRGGSSEANDFWNPLGIVLKPCASTTLTLAYPCDGGTEPDPSGNGRRIIRHPPPSSAADLRASIANRCVGTPNEWCLWRYEILGFFLEHRDAWVGNDESGDPICVNVEDIWELFPDVYVYRLDGSGDLWLSKGKSDPEYLGFGSVYAS